MQQQMAQNIAQIIASWQLASLPRMSIVECVDKPPINELSVEHGATCKRLKATDHEDEFKVIHKRPFHCIPILFIFFVCGTTFNQCFTNE